MIEGFPYFMALLGALGAGVVGGIFFAFSTFVMRALARLPPEHGIGAMKAINVAVINAAFMAAFLGTAGICLVLGGYAALQWSRPGSGLLLAGSLLYLVGTLIVTLACNVPRNNALAGVEPSSTEAVRIWSVYLKEWTWWNHVRTAAALAAAAAFTLALRQG